MYHQVPTYHLVAHVTACRFHLTEKKWQVVTSPLLKVLLPHQIYITQVFFYFVINVDGSHFENVYIIGNETYLPNNNLIGVPIEPLG
jgi:hypothetical protein